MEVLTILKANIRRKKGSFISVIILMVIISMAFTSFLSIKKSCTESVKNALTYADAANITIYINEHNMSDELMESIENNEMVDRAEKIIAASFDVAFHDEKDSNGYFIQKYDSSKFRRLTDDCSGYSDETGKPKKGEIYVTQGVLTRQYAKMGDTVKVYYNLTEYVEMKIAGIVVEPTNGASVMGWKQAFVSDEDFETLLQKREEKTYILKIYKKAECQLTDRQFRRQLNMDTFVIDKAIGSITRAESQYYTLLYSDIVISILMVFLVFLMTIVLIVMRHSISTSIEIDYVNLGVLKAMGFSKHKIRSIFVLQYLLAQILGAVIGFVIAIPIVNLFGNIFQPITAIPNENKIAVIPCLLILAGILILSALFVILSTRKINKISPVRAISGGKSEIYFDSRLKAPIEKKLLSSSIALRQFTSNKRRYTGTIVIATVLVFFMVTVTALGDSVNSKSAIEAMGFIYTEINLDLKDADAYDEKAEEIDGIIEKYTKIEKKYMIQSEYISINGENIFCTVYKNPEAMNIIKGRAALYDNEIVITEFISEELGIKMGDTVTVSKGGRQADFIITGYTQCTNDTGRCFNMNLDGVKRMGLEDEKIYYVGYCISDISHLEDIKKELTEKYGAILECDAWDPDSESSDIYNMAIDLMKVVIYSFSIVFALVVTVMVCKKSFLQEKTDIGIYKAIGFKLGRLRLQFAVRFLIVAIISSVIGVGLSMMLSEKLVALLLRSIGISVFKMIFTAKIFALPVLLICGCFFAFSYLVSRRIRNVDVKELITE